MPLVHSNSDFFSNVKIRACTGQRFGWFSVGYVDLISLLMIFTCKKKGMPISEAISVIQQNIDYISLVELKFSEQVCTIKHQWYLQAQDPLAMDIILDLVEDGFLLRFEPASQRLKMIEIYDVPKVTLSYTGSVFRFVTFLPSSFHPWFFIVPWTFRLHLY